MRRHLTFAALVAAWLLSATAFAAPPPMVHADEVVARIDYRGLVLEFPQPMRIWDNERRDDIVSVSPHLPTQCTWNGDTVMLCRFEKEHEPALATRYRIDLATGLKTQSGLDVGARTLHAETARPQVRAEVRGWKDGLPDVVVTSNDGSTAEQLRAVLRLAVDGAPVALPALRPLGKDDSRRAQERFGVNLPVIAGHDRELVLSVVPGLRSASGPLEGVQDTPLVRVLANESFALRGVTCRGPASRQSAYPERGAIDIACLPDEAVRLVFSRPLDEASRKRVERALPEGAKVRGWESDEDDWRYDADDAGAAMRGPAQWLEFQSDSPRNVHTVELVADLRAEGQASAFTPVRVTLRNGDYRPQLRTRHEQSLLASSNVPPTLVEGVNAAAVDFTVTALGRQSGSETLRVPERRGNTPQPMRSPLTGLTLAQDGWVQWERKVDSSVKAGFYRSPSTVQFAAPAFDLFAVAGRREVLAWANAWDGNAAVASARVELLWWEDGKPQPRVLALATTDANGVARMRLPDDFMLPDADGDDARKGKWLLRAATAAGEGASRAVLPYNTWRTNLGQAPERMIWGVSDRPLYRAGDTVRYRLWQRDRHGATLQAVADAPALQLRLYNDSEDSTILEWRATPRADGSVEGDLVLPVHLTDGIYCIGAGSQYDVEGTCFYVGTYRAQDLWVQANGPKGVLRDGDRLVFELQAGYYSGGAAAGLEIAEIQSELVGLPLDQAYPQYAGYEFVDVEGDDVESAPLKGIDEPGRTLDREGRTHFDLPVDFDLEEMDKADPARLPAFGDIALRAEVKPDDRDSTTSNEVAVRYARFARYVGLRIEPRWLDGSSPVRATGVLIDAEGKPQPGASIEVEVDYLPGFMDEEAKPQRVARCSLKAGVESLCDFQRARSGRYRITARSGDAAPAQLMRYAWVDGDDTDEAVDDPTLELMKPPEPGAVSAQLMLKQPFARARALLLTVAHDELLDYQVQDVAGEVSTHAIPLEADRRKGRVVLGYVRDAAPTTVVDGYRKPAEVVEVEASLPWSEPVAAASPPISVSFEPAAAAPGAGTAVVLRNNGSAPRDVVLSVMDDALRSLAGRWLAYSDPLGHDWLAQVWRQGRDEAVNSFGFSDWNDDPWSLALPWPKTTGATDSYTIACRTGEAEVDCATRRAIEAADAAAGVAASADAAVMPAKALPAPPPPEAPALILEAPRPTDVYQRGQLTGGFLGGTDDDGTTLDRVEVTGSRLRRSDLAIDPGGAPDPSLRRALAAREARAMQALARVRTRFADTALWRSDIRLAPGETRRVELTLPDNLTRWRAVAWSNDAGEDFAMTEATLEVGLPVEVRVQTPVRIYPGDRARLAANVRQTGDAPAQASATLDIAGIGPASGHAQTLALAPGGQASIAMDIAPQDTGTLIVTASAQTTEGHDAVAAPVEVASPLIAAHKVQAGWLGDTAIELPLPTLPPGARDAQLQVSLLRGDAGLVQQWTHDLRDYPHRCWEQILSRAVAAALALERGDAGWPDAKAVVQEAVDNAAVFQDSGGGFVYFAESSENLDYSDRPRTHVPLTAYSVRAFELLRVLGHPVAAEVESGAREYLANAMEGGRRYMDPKQTAKAQADRSVEVLAQTAYAASARQQTPAAELDALWSRWSVLPLPARIAAARAFARNDHASADAAMESLLTDAPARGSSRLVTLPQRYDLWMSSTLREQCALVELLGDYPRLDLAGARRALVAGMTDLYVGGIASVDTQTGASCLIALRDMARAAQTDSPSARFSLGDASAEVAITAGQVRADARLALPANPASLRVEPRVQGAATSSYIARLEYQEDARQARAAAVGFSIERHHEVLRKGEWVALQGQTLREGDWVRITLAIDSVAPRQFVAVTDALPGGLRPIDLALSGVGGIDVERVSDTGSRAFATRRLDPRNPRFYAEHLPAGRSEVHYFARAGNGGDYLAAPAMVELMYGDATTARTAASRVVIGAAAKD